MTSFRMLLLLLAVLLSSVYAAPKPLQTIKGCTFKHTEWADGDSFQVVTPQGDTLNIRLYAVDCLETRNDPDSAERRLYNQRAYFGITGVKGDARSPVALAIRWGERARSFSEDMLAEPFTIHTRHHKAPGDPANPRIYAFVETHMGGDLAQKLVEAGLARVKGHITDRSEEWSRERYHEHLLDLEIRAAKKGEGIWEHTDWDKLPDERDFQRKEDEDNQEVKENALDENFRLNPNTADREELDLLPGIGERLADAIIEAREELQFEEAKDLMRVPGIKHKTLAKFERYLDFHLP